MANAKVIYLAESAQLRAAERHLRETPARFTTASLSDDGEDRILLHLPGGEPTELTEGAALTLGHHLLELVRVKRAGRGPR